MVTNNAREMNTFATVNGDRRSSRLQCFDRRSLCLHGLVYSYLIAACRKKSGRRLVGRLADETLTNRAAVHYLRVIQLD